MNETNTTTAPAVTLLETRHLQVIDALHRLGTVTAAAGELSLSQPAVSHALREIQRRLGVTLTRRAGRGLRLTAAGETLARRARALLVDLRRAELEVMEVSGRACTLRITTQCYTCFHWLPPALGRLRTRQPELRLELVTDAVADPLAALLGDRVDLAIVHGVDDHAEIERTELFEDELVAIVPSGHPLAELPHLELEHFVDAELLFHFDPESSALMVDVLGPAGVRPRAMRQLRLTEAVIESVKAGLGIAVMARWAVTPHLREGTLRAVRVTADGLRRRWWAASRHGESSPASRDLIAILQRSGLG